MKTIGRKVTLFSKHTGKYSSYKGTVGKIGPIFSSNSLPPLNLQRFCILISHKLPYTMASGVISRSLLMKPVMKSFRQLRAILPIKS